MLLRVALEMAVHVLEAFPEVQIEDAAVPDLDPSERTAAFGADAVQEPGSYGPGMCGLVRPSRGRSDDNAIGRNDHAGTTLHLGWDKRLLSCCVLRK
jgi:hypothetical protein